MNASISNRHTVGDALVQYLHELGVRQAYGVLSIHNMPLLDALGRDGRIRFRTIQGAHHD